MRQARHRRPGLALLLLSGLLLGLGCRSHPPLAIPAREDRAPATSPSRNDATGATRPGVAPSDAPASLEPSERRPAEDGDPFGHWMVEVLVLDEEGRPIRGAQVESVRGGDLTNRSGRAWVPPLGLDMGRPSRDREYKTLLVRAPGHAAEERWMGSELGTLHVFRLRRER